MKLPFMPGHALALPEPVSLPWQTLVLVCSKCKGARGGPDPRAVRKGLKHRLGKSKSLRIAEVECLQVCPDRAVTVCSIATAPMQVELVTVESEGALDTLAAKLGARLR